MPYHAKSQSLKARIIRTASDDIMARAVEAYRHELAKKPGQRRRSMRTVCSDFEDLFYNETGKRIKLSHVTMARHIKGGQTLAQFNSSKSHLTDGEVDLVIGFITECGNRGFPLSHRRVKEHVDQILRGRLGPTFEGVGQNWTHRFAEKYHDRIKVSWATSLEEKRGQGANPHANEAWWKLLESTLRSYDILPENTYGVDKVGVQPSGGMRERVFGARRKGMQYQQHGGTRENITVLVTICADGTSQAPTVIFKGSAYQVKWAQNNPLNASIGYQKKGWTDGEIGAEWMKIFDAETAAKAGKKYRLLLVDGHNSHFTLPFLQHAREHQIIVLCYPSHTTHIYQGLDVVIFSVLKRALSAERDEWLRHGKVIDKTNFLEIYGKAHVQSLTKENIIAAFRKTGIHPYNPNVVTEDMLAPAKETSGQGHLPLPPATPIRAIARLLEKLSIDDPPISEEDENEPVTPQSPSDAASTLNPKRAAFDEALKSLSQTNLAFLLSGSRRVHSTDPMAATPSNPITPSNIPTNLLSIIPTTANEIQLLAALKEAQDTIENLRARLTNLQASNILNEMYCNKLRFQLASKEEKKAKNSEKGRLIGDGLPRMLTGDEFYERVVEFTKWNRENEEAKASRKQVRLEYKERLAAWNKAEEDRKAKNKEITANYHKEVAAWEKRRDVAKKAGKSRQFKELKPKRGPLLKATPKPERHEVEESDGEVFDDNDEQDSDGESDDDDDGSDS